MMKKLVLIAGILGALSAGSAFAQVGPCTGADNAAVGGFNANAPSTPGVVGTADGPAIAQDSCLCNGMAQRTAVNGGGGMTVLPALAQYIKNGFTVTCSANSMVTMSDLAVNRFAIAGASRRGNQMHVGNSATGSVRVEVRPDGSRSCGTQAAPLCTAANVSAALARTEQDVP